MSKFRRLFTVLGNCITIAIGFIILLTPVDTSFFIVAIILGVIISYHGLKNLIFYLSSARHMVGGGKVLVNSIILIDLGSMALLILLENSIIGMLYLVALFIFSGVIDILRSIEIKKNHSKKWKAKFIKGLLIIGVGVLCCMFIKSTAVMALIFGISWIVDGITGMISGFTDSSVLYIPQI